MKHQLLTYSLLLMMSPLALAKEIYINKELKCMQVLDSQILGIVDNEINFKAEGCTQTQIIEDLKVTLSELLTSSTSTNDSLELSTTDMTNVLETLSTKHPGSDAFPLTVVKKVEEFWTGLDSDELKQKGNFVTLTNDLRSDYFLALMYTKEKKELIVIYKTIHDFVDPTDTTPPDDSTIPSEPPTDDLPDTDLPNDDSNTTQAP